MELKANIPTLIYAYFHPDWDIYQKDEVVLSNETYEQQYIRNRLLLEEGTDNAIKIAYELADKEIEILSNKVYITYIDEAAFTNLEIGDQILEVNGIKITSKEDLFTILESSELNEQIILKVKRNNEEMTKHATKVNIEDEELFGLMITEDLELRTEPTTTFNFETEESGPSGGLMTTLYIYDSLIEPDLTNGYTIAGTGTIEADGSVGEISGVEYKIIGAVSKDADIFLVPEENYEEAVAVKKDKNFKIDIVSVKTIEDALLYLNNLD